MSKLLKTKCGCVIRKDSREHDECRCDDNGENWICADCYDGEYDKEEYDDSHLCEVCYKPFTNGKWQQNDMCDCIQLCNGTLISAKNYKEGDEEKEEEDDDKDDK